MKEKRTHNNQVLRVRREAMNKKIFDFRFLLSDFCLLCPPETGWTRSVATEGVDECFPISAFWFLLSAFRPSRAGKDTSAHIYGSVQVIGAEAFSYVFLVIE